MQITQVITFLAIAIVGAVASPGGRPPPPPPPPPAKPTSVVQEITCSGNGNPFCCSPSQSTGTTCTGLVGSSVNCNGVVICCNNNEGTQDCFSGIQGPVTVVP